MTHAATGRGSISPDAPRRATRVSPNESAGRSAASRPSVDIILAGAIVMKRSWSSAAICRWRCARGIRDAILLRDLSRERLSELDAFVNRELVAEFNRRVSRRRRIRACPCSSE
jgi:hypothetical protein